MKFFKLLAAAVIIMTVSACGSEVERDATKMAESSIELNQLMERMKDRSNLHGKPISRRELENYEKKHIELYNQMSEKYANSPEQWNEFQQLVNEKIQKSK